MIGLIREKIQAGKVNEALDVLKKLADIRKDEDLLIFFTLKKGELLKFSQQRRLGTIDFKDYDVFENNLKKSILEVSSEFARDFNNEFDLDNYSNEWSVRSEHDYVRPLIEKSKTIYRGISWRQAALLKNLISLSSPNAYKNFINSNNDAIRRNVQVKRIVPILKYIKVSNHQNEEIIEGIIQDLENQLAIGVDLRLLNLNEINGYGIKNSQIKDFAIVDNTEVSVNYFNPIGEFIEDRYSNNEQYINEHIELFNKIWNISASLRGLNRDELKKMLIN